MDDRVTTLVYASAKKWLTGNSLDARSTIRLTVFLIPLIQKLVQETGRGPYKKIVLLTVIRKIIADDVTWRTKREKEDMLLLVDLTLPSVIDTTIGVATGTIDLQKKSFCCIVQ